MNKRITELCNALYSDTILLRTEDELMMQRIRENVRRKAAGKPARRKTGLAILVAVISVLLLAGTAAAVGFGMQYWKLEEPMQEGVILTMEDDTLLGAENEFRFEVAGEPMEVSFEAEWLPGEPSKTMYNRNGACVFVQHEGDSGVEYQVAIYDGSVLRDYAFLMHGTAEVLTQDIWNGWERMQITATTPDGVTNNHILLYSAEHSYLLSITGFESMETLQKIANNLTVHVSGLPAVHVDGWDSDYIYLTGGLENWNNLEYREESLLQGEWDVVPDDCGMHMENLDDEAVMKEQLVAVFADGSIGVLHDKDVTAFQLTPAAAVSFHISGEMHSAEFRANWLPEESDPVIEAETTDGWCTGLEDEGNEFLYQIDVRTGDRLSNSVIPVIGNDYELIGVDEWNGMQRIRYSVSDMKPETAQYLLLFSQDGNYLITVSGYADMETLEKIAENLEIRTLEETLEPEPLAEGFVRNGGLITVARG